MTTFWTVSGDAADPHCLAEFWKLALGYIDEPDYDFVDGAALIDPEGVLPPIGFLKLPEGKTAKNRVHLDLQVAGGGPSDEALRERRMRDKAAELVDAGETVVREYAFENVLDHFVVQDPEG